MTDSDIYWTFVTACQYGGSFYQALGQAGMKADPGNKQRILDAFPEMVATYGAASRRQQVASDHARRGGSMTSNADYHADPAISASHLHAVAASPYHYWSRFLAPDRPPSVQTAAMKLGSLTHCAVLEPDELAKRYGVCLPRNTKAGKEMESEMAASGIEAVTSTDMEQALAMAASVRSHQAAAALLRDGKAEQSFWWDDIPTGLRCKCRPDWYTGSTIVDLKTTTDASPRGFAKSVAQWRYHVQQNHYLAGTFAERFVFIAVEKTYPYAVGVYELDEAAALYGESERRTNLQTIADCRAIAEWPGYGNTIQPLSLPNWALYGTSTITSDDF